MTSLHPRILAHSLAVGRVGIGAVALVAPTIVSRPWIGEAADTPAVQLFARAMGGRDLALGLGALRALHVTNQEARPWMAAGGMADTVDTVVTLVAFGRLPRRTRWGILALTAGAALVSARVAAALDTPAPATAGSTRSSS